MLWSITFSQKSCHLWDNVEEHWRAGLPKMAIWLISITCWIPKSTNTRRIYNSYCFSTATMVAQMQLNVALNVQWDISPLCAACPPVRAAFHRCMRRCRAGCARTWSAMPRAHSRLGNTALAQRAWQRRARTAGLVKPRAHSGKTPRTAVCGVPRILIWNEEYLFNVLSWTIILSCVNNLS
jgi:hypothetical protein